MFFLTFVLIDSIEHFRVNINRIYMALIMAAPMVIVMLLVCDPCSQIRAGTSFYRNRRVLISGYWGNFISLGKQPAVVFQVRQA
jgi:hypothetical protein